MKRMRIKAVCSLVLAAILACALLPACVQVEQGQGTNTGQSLSDLVDSGLSMQAEQATSTLKINRPKQQGTKPANIGKDTWTVFVYLCGSDLESNNGAATKDLSEMVSSSGSKNVTFVIETGGAKKWQSNIKTNQLGRYVIQNGTITQVDSLAAKAMGEPSTLSDFLTWGLQNYPAENMGVILWDHGGGSITGVCFDERNNYDALSLKELDTAFSAANKLMWEKFEFVGFDACLMGTLEAANVLASYANYMIASQESEPATGWEYSSTMDYLSKHPSCTGAELGRALCDNYYASLKGNSALWSTLSLIDLSQIDNLIQSFYRFSQEMYASGKNQSTLAAMTRGIKKAENYGSNNWLEGYTNMVDLQGIISACASVTPSAAEAQAALNKAVIYQVKGRYHNQSCGLSTYYPLNISNAKELSTFQQVAANPAYLSYIDRLVHGGTYSGGSEYTAFPDDTWYEGGIWTSETTTEEDQQQSEQYWSYVDQHTGESTVISYAQKPQLDSDGNYWFQFSQDGLNNATVVSGLVYEVSEDGQDLLALGETYDVYGDWSTGVFRDGFNGKWLSLPDGQNLCTYVVESTNEYVVYTSPINLNGTDCYLRMHQNFSDNKVVVEGAWSGIGQNGAVDRSVTKLKRGDVIIPLYDAMTTGSRTNESVTYEGVAYKITGKSLSVTYNLLPDGTYYYSFSIQDSFGNRTLTDPVTFEIDVKGNIYFIE